MKTIHPLIAALAALTLGFAQPSCLAQAPARSESEPEPAAPVVVRVATFNIEDLRTKELVEPVSERVKEAAEIIQRIRPTIILINELAYDMPGAPGYDEEAGPGANARRLAELLATEIREGVAPLQMTPFTAETNTGRASGFDLDRNGEIVTLIPPPTADGSQTAEGRAFGGDAWGFGTFPGQYGMALLVDDRLTIREEYIRTFRLFPWSRMPNALLPEREPDESENADESNPDTQTDEPSEENSGETASTAPAQPKGPLMWYEDEAGTLFRLSSKSHWDIPVELPNGAVIHVLASHPTPPAFDGPEARNKKRNHDEIRFWADYIDNAEYILDDQRRPGGLPARSHFVIVGDLNADPDEGSSWDDPIGEMLLASRWVGEDPAPTSPVAIEGLDADDTARFGLRVDYVLPSKTLTVRRSGVWRHPVRRDSFPSDHFPVWADLVVPPAP